MVIYNINQKSVGIIVKKENRMKEEQDVSLYQKLLKQLVIAFVIFLFLFTVKQLLIRNQIEMGKDTYLSMNVAERQRVLSQKIVKDLSLIQMDSLVEVDLVDEVLVYEDLFYLKDMEKSIQLWEKSQQEMLKRFEAGKFLKRDSRKLHQMFKDIDPIYSKLLFEVKQISSEIRYGNGQVDYANRVPKILTLEEAFSKQMDKILDQYEIDSEKSLQEGLYLNEILFWAIIAIIVFVLFKIFIPLLRNSRIALWKERESRSNLTKMFHLLRGSLLLVNPKGEIYFKNQEAENYILKEKNPSDVLHIDTCINWKNFDIREYIENLRNNSDKQKEVEIQIGDRDGSTRWVILAGVIGMYNGEEKILFHFYDITVQQLAKDALQNVAVHDELTGLYNRHFLDSVVDDEFERARRYDLPLSGALLDLDHFKRVNDTWGHPVGDSVLKFTAELIHNQIRRSDYAIRIGGEEFLILMPNTDGDGAYINAEKIRKAVEDAEYPVVGHITASLGVAERRVDDDYQFLYEKIDRALYQAKETGRNRVVKSKELDGEYASVSLQWKQGWDCGEANIDSQHRELFYLLSHLMKCALEEMEKQQVLDKIDEIVEHVLAHFNYEESVLIKEQYLEVENHKKIHGQLIRRMHEIKSLVSQEEMNELKAFTVIFQEVVADHLLKDDVQFFSLFKQ